MVLCLAMMLSIMVVGAGAAFSDAKDIDTKHQEAVDMCVSLNIINGNPDNTFKPNDNVTREQMAKMICVLDNGGKEPSLAPGSSFTDVAADRWSNKYIEACATRGVVAGVGDNKFDPAGNVTATQAAKMLLVELGYDQDIAKYVGASWATNVNLDATKKGYYKDLEDIDVSAPLTREHAAEMIWNALQATEVEYNNTLSTDANGNLSAAATAKDKTTSVEGTDVPVSLLMDKYGTNETIGIMTGAGALTIARVAPGEDKFEVNGGRTFELEGTDVTNLIGQQVKVISKVEKGEVTVYGVFATDKNTVQSGTVDQLDKVTAASLKLGSKTLKLDDAFVAYDKTGAEGQYAAMTTVLAEDADPGTKALSNLKNAFDIQIIDNNDDGKYDIALIDTKLIGQVASANSKTFTIKQVGAVTDSVVYQESATIKLDYDDEDITNPTIYDGMAKDDFVVCSYDGETGALIVEKATVLSESEISGINSGKFTIDSTTYKTDTADDNTKALGTGDQADFVVYGNYIYTHDSLNANVSASDYVVVLGSKDGDQLSDNQVKILRADGTTEVVTAKNTAGDKAADVDDNALVRYKVYTVKTSGDKMKFTKAEDKGAFDNILDNTNFAYNSDNNTRTTLGGARIADDAIILYLDKEGDPQVMTGKTLQGTKTLGDLTNNDNASAWANDGSNGVKYVQYAWLGQVSDVKSGADTTVYAYVVDACGTTKDGDDTVATITVASGDDESTVLICDDAFAAAATNKPATGDFIKYDLNNAGKVDLESVTILEPADELTDANVNKLIAVAITGVEGDSAKPTGIFATVAATDTGIVEFTTDDDTQIVYVDVQEQVGGADVGASKAGKNEAGYVKNAYIVYEKDGSDNLIKALFVESDNDITA
jgi:hypothetical protein